MGRRPIQIEAGARFGRLTVTGEAERGASGHHRFRCLCDCGTKTVVVGSSLLRKNSTRSCGCLHRESTSRINRKHGESASPEFRAWALMKRRCSNPKDRSYHNYGGRGIQVCERWLHSFENFLADMGPKPSPRHSIDRIDSNGNYEPANCRWATWAEQCNNKRTSSFYTLNGETRTLAEWCERLGVNRGRVVTRLRKGWDFERAVTQPKRSADRKPEHWTFPVGNLPGDQNFTDVIEANFYALQRSNKGPKVGDTVTFTSPDVSEWPTYERLDIRISNGIAWRVVRTEKRVP